MVPEAQRLRNFRRLQADVDTRPFLEEIAANEQLWLFNTARQDTIPVQRETNTIFLRAAAASACDVNDEQHSVTTRHAAQFPLLMNFLRRFARRRKARLERAMIVRLKPNGRVYAHVDFGMYYALRDRFHLVLASAEGNEFTCGCETTTLQPGELWWFNNKLRHSTANNSLEWRVHAIFDLLPHAAQN